MRRLRLAALCLTLLVAASCGRGPSRAATPQLPAAAPVATASDTIVAAEAAAPAPDFSVSAIPDSIFALMEGCSFRADCTTPRSELRYLTCLHVNAEGDTLRGEMVVHRAIADTVLSILRQLYEAHYPIERMRLIDHYGADDLRSMEANNSSAFNFRFVSHTRTVSKHGLGMAVDINPLYNPYHRPLRSGQQLVEPASGAPYLDRTKRHPYMIRRGDLCYRLFRQAGFRWGGDWTHSKDYQHFEK